MPNLPASVRKRSGTVAPFDSEKVTHAVKAAWKEVHGTEDDPEIDRAIKMALRDLPELATVEDIQDAIEVALMRVRQFAVAKAFIVYREKRSEVRNTPVHPNPTAVSEYIHASKYARYLPELQRREVYDETVARVEMQHQKRFSHIPELRKEISKAFDFVREKRLLPSMRSLQFGGLAVEANPARQYNCSASLVDRPRVFAETMFLLLSGCGVGYSVQFDHVERLPALKNINEKIVTHHVISDSIEGWADAIDALINSYIDDGHHVEFSYAAIRPAGSPLKISGGRAPGHMKLKRTIERIRSVLWGAQGRQLRPIECHRIMCHIADAVLSGGIRRSACIALFSYDDSEMMNCKADISWFTEEPWLANANNSVVFKRDEVSRKQFDRVLSKTRHYGEPGFFFVEDYDHATNPCQPGWATVLTPDGIRTFDDIQIGSTIWSGKQWTKVTNKVMTGIKPVFGYHTEDGVFIGTENHRVIQRGERVEVRHADSIDLSPEPACGTPWDSDPDQTRQITSDTQTIKQILSWGEHLVYDITVEAEEHTYWTGGLLVSNCAEILLQPTLAPFTDTEAWFGGTGFAFCNLSEINAAKLTSLEDFLEVARAATLIGTLQASYTEFPYLGPVTEAIAKRDALLGVGMTGIQDRPDIACNPEYQRIVSAKIKEWNAEFAALIGINPAARTTTVKPAGSTSLAIGGVGSGIHPHHAKRYIRRVTADELELVFQHFRASNPTMCVRKPDGKWVIEFPVEAPEGARLREHQGAVEFLKIVQSTQQNWVVPGTARGTANHNVSNTVNVRDEEWSEVADYIWDNRHEFSGVSLLSDAGDQIYAFAPFEAVQTKEQERRWRELATSYVPVDYHAMFEAEDGTALSLEAACAGGACER
jgi:ATP cone domain